ncbi:hypothetical protein GC207_07360 [bacterium]|nr:hypothetical protein [bacterium]
MNSLRSGAIGILPPGALGVSLFHHLTHQSNDLDGEVCFLSRSDSSSTVALRAAGILKIQAGDELKEIPLPNLLKGDLITCFRAGELPEALLICTNPDQLLDLVSECVALLETVAEAGLLSPKALPFPAVVLCSNGIYYQRVRQVFIEKLEEATLFGRLPDLWPDLMPAIVGRWLRGVSIQTGVRDGSGASAIYRPGPSGITRIAGGDREIRQRVVQSCVERGAWFEDAGDLSPTRIEFDKAIVNLASNLIGLLLAIDEQGHFHRLQIGEVAEAKNHERLEKLATEVFRVGRAVRAYSTNDELSDQVARLHQTLDLHRDHVPSSVQWVDVQLRRGELKARLTPTEKWLLEPLVRYALAAHLPDTAHYFKSLERELIAKLRKAIGRRGSDM